MSTATRSEPAAAPGRLRRALQIEITPKKVKPLELLNFCRYLSTFLSAGVPVLDALDIIREETTDTKLARIIADLDRGLRAGGTISDSIQAHRGSFPSYFVDTVRSAEETGQLAVVLGQLATYIERDLEARRRFTSALTYPAVVVALALVSVAILVVFVLPQFVTFFQEYDAQLPLPTRILIGASDFLARFGLVIVAALVGLALVVGAGTLIGRGRVLRDRALLRVPLVGPVLRYAAVERFSRVLSSMVQAGVPLPVALDLAAQGAGNRYFLRHITRAREQLVQGAGLHRPLAATGLFPSAAIQMLRVGEETGSLDQRLDDVSNFYGKELEFRLKRLIDLLEPAAVVVVGVVVGFVAVAIVSAIYGVFNGTALQ